MEQVELEAIVRRTLMALRFFEESKIAVVAELIGELVKSIEDAVILCRHIRDNWDEYPGPATLREEAAKLFSPSPAVEEFRGGPSPPCAACGGSGSVEYRPGRFRSCPDCRTGRRGPQTEWADPPHQERSEVAMIDRRPLSPAATKQAEGELAALLANRRPPSVETVRRAEEALARRLASELETPADPEEAA